ncbi:MAG: hypothetical protein Q7J78_02330 [Clostridiales bacterium]|nr:hypothetical protein [Clostridiales bacterium]
MMLTTAFRIPLCRKLRNPRNQWNPLGPPPSVEPLITPGMQTPDPIISEQDAQDEKPEPYSTPEPRSALTKKEIQEAIDYSLEITSNKRAETLSAVLGVDAKFLLEMKSELGSWDKVVRAVKEQKRDAVRFSDEEVKKLYDEGLGILEIEQAEEFAYLSGESAAVIMEKFRELKEEGLSVEESWNRTAAVFDIDTTSEESPVPLYLEKPADGKEIHQYTSSEEKELKLIKEQLGLTDEDIQKCKDAGVNTIEIVTVKYMADKYGVTMDRVLEIRKDNTDWAEIEIELGAGGEGN